MRQSEEIRSRLDALRQLMKENQIDAYFVPTSDAHDSECVSDYFKVREYLSGFTGSAGTLVVLADEAGLWTDGRYFIQAQTQLAGSGITLYRMGQPGVPNIVQYLLDKLPQGACLGFDGKVVAVSTALNLHNGLKIKQIRLRTDLDLGGSIWKERPALPCSLVYMLGLEYAGEDVEQKLARLRNRMQQLKVNVHLLTTLDDIAWLFNIRANDIECTPVALAYAKITAEEAVLYIQEKAVSCEVIDWLKNKGICVAAYDSIYEDIRQLPPESQVLLDRKRMNYALYRAIPAGISILDKTSPITLMKAIKNPVEQKNIRQAHIKDGLAVTRFIYWLKKNIGKMEITEMQAAEYLDNQRKALEHYVELSFPTISAYGSNAAMCHYSATKETDTQLKPEGFLLVDSGGQYLEGTTDITRTIVLGPVTQEQKLHFTLVLKGMIDLAMAKFLHGCRGWNLDYLARGPLWRYGLDFNHGTGHGVGYLLNVHEMPNNFRWKKVAGEKDSAVLEEGMLTSDEPGLYLENQYGIRTENLLLCKKAECNAYGQFMEFEIVTMAPIDREAVLPELLTVEEREWLNHYHKKVYEVLSPNLTEEETEWLKEMTTAI